MEDNIWTWLSHFSCYAATSIVFIFIVDKAFAYARWHKMMDMGFPKLKEQSGMMKLMRGKNLQRKLQYGAYMYLLLRVKACGRLQNL